jgi:hypothetical protein
MCIPLELECGSRDRAGHFDLRPLSLADESYRSIISGLNIHNFCSVIAKAASGATNTPLEPV